MAPIYPSAGKRHIGVLLALAVFALLVPAAARAATMSLSPTAGAFEVGSTFNVSVLLDTEGATINALQIELDFPANKLQLVSPTAAGSSLVQLWVTPPKFNNATGRVELQGGIPEGINVSRGTVITLTFRVKSTGTALVRFLDASEVYLHDGQGTESLTRVQNGVYELTLPAPQGPIVASSTHPEQNKWYTASNVQLTWAPDVRADGYSYELNREPVSVPDNTSEGARNSVAYTGLADGTHFFHIKALRDGRWGGVTHYALNVDSTAPAEFSVEVSPSERTSNHEPVLRFLTTDAASGVSHYELKIVPTSLVPEARSDTEQLFFEAQSPFVLPFQELGSYDILVRAYDKAGNYREAVQELEIVSPFLRVEKQGIVFGESTRVSWFVVFSLIILALVAAGVFARHVRRWHFDIDIRKGNRELPDGVKERLQELKKYRSKYGKLAALVLLGFSLALAGAGEVQAQSAALNPPSLSTVSQDISNEEILYAGGKAEVPESAVLLYIQNLRTGETTTRIVPVDKKSDWFYRHDAFLSTGEYLLWGQARVGEEFSPPSPQVRLTVRPTAIQFGGSRVSTEDLYLALSLALVLLLFGLLGYTGFQGAEGRRKEREVAQEIREAEEALRRGFAVLRRDLQAELAQLQGRKPSKAEEQREQELLQDLADIEQSIGSEIRDIEEVGYQ